MPNYQQPSSNITEYQQPSSNMPNYQQPLSNMPDYQQPSSNIPEDIGNLYINIQDYLDIINLLFDKTKDTFISVNTVLENMKPYIYRKK